MYWIVISNCIILTGPFAVIDEHFNTILSNSYDAIGLMLMIRLTHQHQVFLLRLFSYLLLICDQFNWQFTLFFSAYYVKKADSMLGLILGQGVCFKQRH